VSGARPGRGQQALARRRLVFDDDRDIRHQAAQISEAHRAVIDELLESIGSRQLLDVHGLG